QNHQLAQHNLLQFERSALHWNGALCLEREKATEVFPGDGHLADLRQYLGRRLARSMTSEGHDETRDTEEERLRTEAFHGNQLPGKKRRPPQSTTAGVQVLLDKSVATTDCCRSVRTVVAPRNAVRGPVVNLARIGRTGAAEGVIE